MTFGHIQPLTVLPSLEIKPVIRPSITQDAFYLLTVQIDNTGIEEGVDIYQASIMGAHWSSKCIHFDADSSTLVHVAGGSRFTTLAFELAGKESGIISLAGYLCSSLLQQESL